MSPIEMYGIIGGVLALLTVFYILTRRSFHRWETVLDAVAREFRGRHTKGTAKGIAMVPGYVDGKVDGRALSIRTGTRLKGASGAGDSRESRYMEVELSTTKSKPEFFGPERARRWKVEVADYQGRGSGEMLEIAGAKVDSKQLPKRFRHALTTEPEATALLERHFQVGGCIENGTVVLRTTRFERDSTRLIARVREMAAIADLLD